MNNELFSGDKEKGRNKNKALSFGLGNPHGGPIELVPSR